jgi:hypothetical protein
MREFTRQTRYLQKSGTSGQEREEGRRTRGSSDPFVFRDRKSGGARCLPGSLATTRGRSCERKCSSLASREGPSQTCRGCVFSGRVSAVRGRLSNGANRYSRRASFSHLTRRLQLPAKSGGRFFAWTSPAQSRRVPATPRRRLRPCLRFATIVRDVRKSRLPSRMKKATPVVGSRSGWHGSVVPSLARIAKSSDGRFTRLFCESMPDRKATDSRLRPPDYLVRDKTWQYASGPFGFAAA